MPKAVVRLLLLGTAALTFGCATSSRIRVEAPPLMRAALERAQDLIGTPYCSSGMTPDCFDCSGFVGYSFRDLFPTLPRTSSEMFLVGKHVDISDLQAGDLVFFSTSNRGTVNHVGIYLADDRFIHSATSRGVMLSTLSEPYWKRRWKGARRVTGTE
ncbi:MAG: hypothetical protein RL594_1276 [Bacteroidota bacterium]|jgi:cell wall-associated NlpC family hydrolase